MSLFVAAHIGRRVAIKLDLWVRALVDARGSSNHARNRASSPEARGIEDGCARCGGAKRAARGGVPLRPGRRRDSYGGAVVTIRSLVHSDGGNSV